MPEKRRLLTGRRKSIAWRLAVLHILAVLFSYTVFGVIFYDKRIRHKESKEARELAAEIASINTMIRKPNGRDMLEYEIGGQLFAAENSRMYIRILDRGGRVYAESADMASSVPVTAFPPLGDPALRWQNPQGDHFVLRWTRLPDGIFCGPGCTLQVATNSNDRSALEYQLRMSLSLFGVAGLIFSFVCAYFMVRITLKPLDDISNTARSITRRDLHTRIDQAALPRELVSLGHSFNAMLARLEGSFERLSHYSGNLAHELRTPINTLMIAAEIALSRDRSAEEYRGVLASSLEELGRISTTIDKMLFLARADIERPDLALERLDVATEVESVIDFYSDAASEAGISLEGGGSAPLHADQALFRRAMSNLISNSLAHTPRGGRVQVTCRATETGETVVAVADNGCGIPCQHLPKILDRFYRAPGAGARTSEGTGLGLAIVKAIMDMHEGSISITSAPGAGTEVTLSFPSRADAGHRGPSTPPSPSPAG